MPRRRNASTRILHTVVLPTLGVLATACEHNPFVADQPQPVTTPDPNVRPTPVGQFVSPTVGSTIAPGVPVIGAVPPPGVMPIPPGTYAPPPPPGVAPRPPGVAAPGTTPWVGSVAPPPVGTRHAPGRPIRMGRAPSRSTDDIFKPAPDVEEATPAARADSRRMARMSDSDERDPGCAGAGSIRRRGPA